MNNEFIFDNLIPQMSRAILETIPVEITIIDANDEVVACNKHTKRIFTRPLIAMGRNFRKCHPEKSLHLVEK
ncbi:MAG: PAS domain-containing protein [Elusimicrobiales bacterium]|nr:PAS domain-containing protein [Elusimicrobiales bacterium]